jgi:DNA polymerase
VTLVVGDFSGIEARALAWCAGDDAELDLIASGADPYKDAASKIYGVPVSQITKAQRACGKISVLACGYGGGEGAINMMAANLGVDLAAAGVTALDIRDGWRKSHPRIVRFWKRIEDAFRAAAQGHESEVDVFTFLPSADFDAVAIVLPTGRPIVYNDVQLVSAAKPWGHVEELTFLGNDPKKSYRFLNGKVEQYRDSTHGGKLTENIIQALCRELLAIALVEAERRGLNPVMHVHDEIVASLPRERAAWGAEQLTEIMSTWMLGNVDWLKEKPGRRAFPLDCDVWTGQRYRK